MPIQTVSRTVRGLQKMGLVTQQEAPDDARKKYLRPSNDFFGRDAMENIVHNFSSQWYHGWDTLDKAKGAAWYFPMSECSDTVAKKQIKQFKKFAKGD